MPVTIRRAGAEDAGIIMAAATLFDDPCAAGCSSSSTTTTPAPGATYARAGGTETSRPVMIDWDLTGLTASPSPAEPR